VRQRVKSPRAIQVVRESLSIYQNLASVVALGATTRPLSDGVACVNGGGLVRLQLSFFLSSLFSVSCPWKFASNLPKNKCVLRFVVCLILALFFLLLFI